jgi:hypothetical protein
MFRLDLCPAAALVLVTCLCAVATPLTTATKSTIYAHAGGHNTPDFARSPCPGHVCEIAFASLAGGTRKLNDRNSTAMFWWEEGSGAHRVAWAGEMLGPFITIDFGSTVNVRSETVWAEGAPGSDEASVTPQTQVGGTRFAIPATPNWNRRAYAYSRLDVIGDSAGISFSQVPMDWNTARTVSTAGSTEPATLLPSSGLLLSGVLIGLGLFRRKRLN